ncbi:MAG: phosphatidylglycerophosphatase A [Phycisphaerae bacterium]|nr:phosphatidylglycerophosphatase A [Phycisphaerae bacterium]
MRRPTGVLQWTAWLLTTGLGTGLSPVAPGTFGTLPGFVLVAVVHMLSAWYWKAALLAMVALLAVPIATWGERFFGEKDPHPVVIDEVVAMPITAVFAPPSPVWLVLAFLLNRALDIVKPPPARRLQALPGGWGIVIDDVLSGLYAGLILFALHRLAGAAIASRLPGWASAPLVG